MTNALELGFTGSVHGPRIARVRRIARAEALQDLVHHDPELERVHLARAIVEGLEVRPTEGKCVGRTQVATEGARAPARGGDHSRDRVQAARGSSESNLRPRLLDGGQSVAQARNHLLPRTVESQAAGEQGLPVRAAPTADEHGLLARVDDALQQVAVAGQAPGVIGQAQLAPQPVGQPAVAGDGGGQLALVETRQHQGRGFVEGQFQPSGELDRRFLGPWNAGRDGVAAGLLEDHRQGLRSRQVGVRRPGHPLRLVKRAGEGRQGSAQATSGLLTGIESALPVDLNQECAHGRRPGRQGPLRAGERAEHGVEVARN